MKTFKETKEFASMAEARAFYLKRNYETVYNEADQALLKSKSLKNFKGEVMINKEGFLKVVAEEVIWK